MPTGKVGKAGKSARFKPGERAHLEIQKYQSDGGYLIPKKAFRRLVGEIFNEATEETGVSRLEQRAIEALQTVAESHVSLVLNGKFPQDCDLVLITRRHVILVMTKLDTK
jgi:histone H3/H4